MNIRKYSPFVYSVVTAFIYAYSLSGFFIAYALAGVLVKFGVTETALSWDIVALFYASAITIYTAIPKAPSLLKFNAALIFVITACMFLLCLLINPEGVKYQMGTVFFLFMYILFFPILVIVIFHLLHRNANLDRALVSDERIATDTTPNSVNVLMEKDYVGKKYDSYYSERFEDFELGGSLVTWNWAAFFCGYFWFVYKGMWVHAFAFFYLIPTILLFLMSGLESALMMMDIRVNLNHVNTYLYMIISYFVLAPLFANYFYFKHVRKSLIRINYINRARLD